MWDLYTHFFDMGHYQSLTLLPTWTNRRSKSILFRTNIVLKIDLTYIQYCAIRRQTDKKLSSVVLVFVTSPGVGLHKQIWWGFNENFTTINYRVRCWVLFLKCTWQSCSYLYHWWRPISFLKMVVHKRTPSNEVLRDEPSRNVKSQC